MRKLLYLLLPFVILSGLSCEKDVTTSPEDILIPKNLLFIDSNPRGSKIYIDGRYMGQNTPDTIKWMEDGDHLVTLKKQLLKDSSVVITIADEYQEIFFDYTTNPTMRGNLYCDSNPRGADIYLNDSLTSLKTPTYIRSLFPGEYDVRYKLPGYWDDQAVATVVSERTITVDENLLDSTVWVNFTMENIGLPTDWFNDIDIQDGYIKWLASEGSGLIKFISAADFVIYNTDNSNIPSNNVKSVRAADNGVWIGTDNGVAFFSNNNFTVYNSSNSIVADSIDCVSPLPGGKVWVGTLNHGVYYYNGSTWTNYNKSNSSVRTNIISSIYADPVGVVWIGTTGEGLILFDGTNWLRIFNALPSPKVDAINIDANNLWIGTSAYTGYTMGSPQPPNPPGPKPVYYAGGLAYSTNNTWTKYKDAGKEIVALVKDDQGNIWFSDYLTGLGKRTSGGYQRYNQYSRINGIAIDGNGHKWMTTSFRGIVKYKGN